jgi:large subunit ribosomal protein L29
MKIKELKSLKGSELEAKGNDFRQELFNLRIRQSTGQLDQPSRLRDLKKGIARVETLLNQEKSKHNKTK